VKILHGAILHATLREPSFKISPVTQRAHRGRDRKPAAPQTGRPRPEAKKGSFLLLLAAALIPILLYWHTTGFGFLLDDFVLFQKSASLSDLASIPKGFLTDVGALRKGSETVLGSYYRPVFLTLSTLYYQMAGGEPFAWHLAAVALVGVIGASACLLFRRLGVPPLPALLASLVFSLHPAHVSSIAWASGLQELLAALFVLLALLALLRRPGAANDKRAIVTAAIAFVLALLSKEVAIGLLPLAGVWAFVRRGTEPEESRRFGKAAAVFGGVTVLYLIVRIAVLGGLAKPWPNAPGLAASLPSIPVAFVAYLRLLVWPVGFSIFRPERPVWRLLDAPVLVSTLAVIALAVLAVLAIRKKRELLLPVAWLLAWLLPVLNFWALDPQWMVTDRYLFLPSLALPWLLVSLIPRRFSIAVLAVLTLVFGALSLRYAAIFKDERTFVAAMEKAEPTSPLIFTEKARLLLRDGRSAAAEAALTRAVELDPRDADALQDLGDLERKRGNFAAAEAHYRRALATEPYASRPFKLLALDLARAGRQQQAFALVEEAAGRWPNDFQVQLMDAVVLRMKGDRAAAEKTFAKAQALRPSDPAVAGGFDAAFARLAPQLFPASP
jgi:tetratricopeptide (TPR) repeat protein